ncbi:MAG: hypothetical protein ACOX0P_01035 [Candidatus Dojkabacteria bacterium]|jgi:hypothetical protein
MIDTVVLSIPCKKEDFRDLNVFTDSLEGIWEAPFRRLPNGYFNTKRNPTSTEKAYKIYVPRLTLIKRVNDGFHTELRIEFSIPKLLFGNNFQEVDDINFEEIVSSLERKLAYMQVDISQDRIRNARISAIHFSKNLVLPKGLSCPIVLNQLAKAVDCNQMLDIKNVSFKNGGQILHIHAKDWEFVVYDKVKELEQAKKSDSKSIENDSYVQFNLLEELKPLFSVLRFEFRLGNGRSIRQMLKRYNPEFLSNKELTFRNLFSKEMAKKMLLGYWNEIKNRYLTISWKEETRFEYFSRLRAENSTLKDNELINIFFLNSMIKDLGISGLRAMMDWNGKKNSYKWTRKRDLLDKLNDSDIRKDFMIREINDQLLRFEIIVHKFKNSELEM